MSWAAGQLLRHAAEEDAAEQKADVWGDRGQAQGSGASIMSPLIFSQMLLYNVGEILQRLYNKVGGKTWWNKATLKFIFHISCIFKFKTENES